VQKQVKTIQPVPSILDKPAKQRILEASDEVFRLYGIRAGTGAIPHRAHSNVATVIKHFGYHERLVAHFIKSLIQGAEKHWREVEASHPNDPETTLRYWIYSEGNDDVFRGETLLSRSAAELQQFPKDPLLNDIEQYWQAERRRAAKLCHAAGFREPGELADKLLLLVHGSRNERKAYGYRAPSQMLSQAGDDLMVAHGATRKPAFDFDDD